ncbi:uncharacterized protein LOC131234948 [Magnolia sinica]|uniref:uncharacterized protein LOC131234948 n=1 Tax=Magnolia sinica TaxID=86752 RepID=UPI0026588B0A|nr:uncharacterized protein LOC131234948 [Magnolia sinica]
MQQSSVLSLSPSLSSYSSNRFAEIASKITETSPSEARNPSADDDADAESHFDQFATDPPPESSEATNDTDDDFEFAFVCRDPNASPISADEIFSNGQIRPIFPIFNRNLLFSESNSDKPENEGRSIRLPLRKLLIEDRDFPSSSSSEADELEGVPNGTYCVWRPRANGAAAASSPDLGKKSNSTGTSKRWRFRDLLHRSNSDGKDTFVFLAAPPKKAEKAVVLKERRNSSEAKPAAKGKGKGSSCEKEVSAAEKHYVRNRALKEGDRRRSFLPYRQDLVGFFANVNGLSRSLHPF